MKDFQMRIILLFLLTTFFSGCSLTPEPKVITEYVEKPTPRLKLRPYREPYKITDISPLGKDYYKVKAEQLDKASEISQLRIYDINFYIRQITDYNTNFATPKDKVE